MFSSILNLIRPKENRIKLRDLALNYNNSSIPKPHFSVSNQIKSQLSKLHVPNLKKMTLNIGSAIVSRGDSPVLARDHLIISLKTYLSKTGKNVTIASGKNILDSRNHILISYPEENDLKMFFEASQKTSHANGPGELFPGSLGMMRFFIGEEILEVRYLQASISFPKAIEAGYLPNEFKRSYSSWATSLLDSLFEHAEKIGISSISLPENRIIEFIGNKKLLEIASKHSFIYERKELDHDYPDGKQFKIWFKPQDKTEVYKN